jgi:DNA-binding response OmpR family regulator
MVSQTGRDLVLIVEDDDNVAEMLHTFLRTKQYQLAVTHQGEEVLDICKERRPGLILLDINLPDMDGYQVCRSLRDNLSTSNIPIIFLTQRNQRPDRIHGFRVGGDDYITKPFDMEELHLRIANALHRAKCRSSIDQGSGLPSGPLVETQLKALLYRDDWAILLVAVENVDRFASRYRHLKNNLCNYVGQLVYEIVNETGNFEDFVGRVGTVEFIVVTTPPRVAILKERIERKFLQVMDPPRTDGQKKPSTAELCLVFGVVQAQEGPYGDVRSLGKAVAQSRTAA